MLTSRHEADEADADRQRLVRVWERDWPYLPPALFALVGERLPATGRPRSQRPRWTTRSPMEPTRDPTEPPRPSPALAAVAAGGGRPVRALLHAGVRAVRHGRALLGRLHARRLPPPASPPTRCSPSWRRSAVRLRRLPRGARIGAGRRACRVDRGAPRRRPRGATGARRRPVGRGGPVRARHGASAPLVNQATRAEVYAPAVAAFGGTLLLALAAVRAPSARAAARHLAAGGVVASLAPRCTPRRASVRSSWRSRSSRCCARRSSARCACGFPRSPGLVVGIVPIVWVAMRCRVTFRAGKTLSPRPRSSSTSVARSTNPTSRPCAGAFGDRSGPALHDAVHPLGPGGRDPPRHRRDVLTRPRALAVGSGSSCSRWSSSARSCRCSSSRSPISTPTTRTPGLPAPCAHGSPRRRRRRGGVHRRAPRLGPAALRLAPPSSSRPSRRRRTAGRLRPVPLLVPPDALGPGLRRGAPEGVRADDLGPPVLRHAVRAAR